MTTLQQFGWNDFHQQFFDQYPQKDLSVGRVISIQGLRYTLITVNGTLEAELSGKIMFSLSLEDLPKVGDWVLYLDYTTLGYIIDIFPRINSLSRKNPGSRTEVQVMAANIDAALVVQGLDRDFNLMRIERYLVQFTACGITPIVILNKADLAQDAEARRHEVMALRRDCLVHICSTVTRLGLKEMEEAILVPRKTYILTGSSGVGKSSLLNFLLRSPGRRTGSISDVTSKGKHTTTSRDLFQLPNGSLMIDTPGMRELGLTSDGGQEDGTLFPAIGKFASGCRFNDCTHLGESGCAVLEALQSGSLEALVYESYVKLMKEQKRFEIMAGDKKRIGKQSGRMAREANSHRKKYKY